VILRDAESRRALRSIVQAVVALAMIPLVAWLIHLLGKEPEALVKIALALLGIVGLGTMFYGSENLTRAIKFKVSAAGAEFESAGYAADAVADAAREEADSIKEPQGG
jgi:hypothetical protein